MSTERAHWWIRAAQTLSRSGLLWLALTVVALSSVASPGAGITTSARLVATSTAGSTGKLRASGPGAPTIIPGELSGAVPHRAQNPEAAAKRFLTGGTPLALVAADGARSEPTRRDNPALVALDNKPAFAPSAFDARAPPRIA